MSKTRSSGMSTRAAYVIGFGLSLVLSIASYALVERRSLAPTTLMMIVGGFAVVQLAVQAVFFLHLDQEHKPHWNLTTLLLILGVLIVLVFGSLWIMANLNYNMHPHTDKTEYIIKDEGFHKH